MLNQKYGNILYIFGIVKIMIYKADDRWVSNKFNTKSMKRIRVRSENSNRNYITPWKYIDSHRN